MRTLSLALPLAAIALGWADAASAQDKAEVSAGYAFVKYLEEDAGNAPVGAYVSIAATSRISLELDLGWQRDSGERFDAALNTFTITTGPRFRWDGSVRPYFHILGGLRYDTIAGENNTSWGGQSGFGIDVPLGGKGALRLGADFQIFFEDDENVKTLRLLAGFTF